jgi:hypothetical protein
MSDSDSFDSDGAAAAVENVKRIAVPKDDDVLLGRGTKHNRNPGNIRYNGTSFAHVSSAVCTCKSFMCIRSLLFVARWSFLCI